MPPQEKRVRAQEGPNSEVKQSGTVHRDALYAPFRALGYITNGVPFVLQVRFGGKDAQVPDVNIVTCIGDTWTMWNAERMTLLFVGPVLSDGISAMAHATSPDSLLVAAGSSVYRYVRGHEVAKYNTSVADEGIEGHVLSSMLVFGDYVCSLAAHGSTMYVWSLLTTELLQAIALPSSSQASCFMHPATYLNKVVLGMTDGSLQLWNVRTASLIHTFDALDVRGGKKSKNVTGVVHMTQSPAVDVLAVAYTDGLVSLFDVRVGEALFSVRVEGGLASGCLAFRTDHVAHLLAVATRAGSIVLFDLNAVTDTDHVSGGVPRLLHSIQHAHDGAIGSIEFVPGQPLLISTGADNALKQWFFESPTLPPRVLKSRSGHAMPPHLIRYYGDDGRAMLSASRDRSLRCLSIVRDSRSFELSQGSIESKSHKLAVEASSLKLTPTTSLSYSTLRSRDWDDVLTTHANDKHAHTWTVRNKHMNPNTLNVARSKRSSAVATTSCVSACGNFALVGTSDGRVEMYNMQSHIHRRTFHTESSVPVSDICCDALNQVCLVSTQDGVLHYFDFFSAQKVATESMPAGCSGLRLHRESNLVAVLTDDLVLSILDLETRRVARRFTGFRGRILDATFSADGRWIVACSTDNVVRTFDIATAQLIDAFHTPSMATSVSFSPAGDFLATAHVDSLGVHLWVNRAQFMSVALRALDMGNVQEEREATLPTVQGNTIDACGPTELDVGEPELQRTYTSPPQLGDVEKPLVTLSTMPRARWMTLLHLDTIRRRNKPTEAPKKPEKMPFFLDAAPTSSSLDGPQQDREPLESARQIDLVFESDMERRLRVAVDACDVGPLFTYLHTLSAPQLDLEIRSLVSVQQQTLFLQALALRMRSKLDFEAVQAMLQGFLACHAEELQAQGVHPEHPDEDAMTDEAGAQLALALRDVLVEQRKEGARLIDELDYCLGTLSFLRHVPLTSI